MSPSQIDGISERIGQLTEAMTHAREGMRELRDESRVHAASIASRLDSLELRLTSVEESIEPIVTRKAARTTTFKERKRAVEDKLFLCLMTAGFGIGASALVRVHHILGL